MLQERCDYAKIIKRQQMIISDLTYENMVLRMALKEAQDPPKEKRTTLADLPPEVADFIKAEAEANGLSLEGVKIITASLR